MDFTKILQKSIDLHVHIGPEIIPRKFSLAELIKYETGKLGGFGVKNHFFPTVAANISNWQNEKYPTVIHSVTLNNYIGGLNPDAIKASAEISNKPIIVWLPTLHTKNFLENQHLEIPNEWIISGTRNNIKLRPAKDIHTISVFDNGEINEKTKEVLKTIKEYNCILATGHISWQESKELVKFATKEIGLKKIIITHPIYQKINMPLDTQKELTKFGAFIEHCFSMYSIDKISINKIVEQIKYVGTENCILSSDVGQVFSKSPSEALFDFIMLLEKEGITKKEIETMLVENPRKLTN